MGSVSDTVEFRVLIKDGESYYYILRVERRKSETFCFSPHAGFHFTEHQSGEAHIKGEKSEGRASEGTPIAMDTGEAGPPCGDGFGHDLGSSRSITNVYVLLDCLDSEYPKYHRNVEGCFIIDKALLPDSTSLVRVGVWDVRSNNEVSFWFNNKGIAGCPLHKVTQCEPQIWVFAEPVA